MPCAKPKFCTLFITGRNWVVCVVLFEPEKSDVNRQALFTNVNYIVGTSACHCFVHCINDKCVFMQITYFLKIIIFSSIQHLRNDARFLLYRNPWSRINRTANLNLYHFVSFKSCEFAFKNKQNRYVNVTLHQHIWDFRDSNHYF